MSNSDLFLATAADIDASSRYRYSLERLWAPEQGVAVWILLNPSTADAEQDDPTIRRCCGFARTWGLGGIVVVNLFAYRATDCRVLAGLSSAVAIGPDNDRAILAACRRRDARLLVAGWGLRGDLYWRDRRVRTLLRGRPLLCLGRTAGGAPRHPLYVAGTTALQEFA